MDYAEVIKVRIVERTKKLWEIVREENILPLKDASKIDIEEGSVRFLIENQIGLIAEDFGIADEDLKAEFLNRARNMKPFVLSADEKIF